jgi:HD-GYP domain-containing protein (c-di-GMP phosphodiesterase class II)
MIISKTDYKFTLNSLIETLVLLGNWHNMDNQHGERTAIMSLKIASRMDSKLQGEEPMILEYAARLHDLGRVGIDDDIMLKPGPLTDAERGAIETHPVIGYNFLCRSNLPKEITLTILHHHENWDGSGYPKKLKGGDIPLFARIVHIADIWDALTADRPYRKAMVFEAALNTMNVNAGYFDPELYTIFLEVIKEEDRK